MTFAVSSSGFDRLRPQPADTLLALIGMHMADRRPDTIDVGVGVYRDEQGRTPVLLAVKTAEQRLAATQATKVYLGPEGNVCFTESLAEVVFGASPGHHGHRVGVQTPGGTGALRLGAELLARTGPDACVWLSTPTWANHAPVFGEAGLRVAYYRYFDPTTRSLDAAGAMEDLSEAAVGDVVLFHGCGHNPTGADLSVDDWHGLAAICAARGLIPFVDLAYHGLGDGLDADAAGPLILVNAVGDALVAYSCDKNFGMYRERVGALWVSTETAAAAALVEQNLLSLARSLWSMPPDHGAEVVRMILKDDELKSSWRRELDGMRERLNDIRQRLAAAHPSLAPIARQRGLFATLPIDFDDVRCLREENGIYMAPSGRINVAGLRRETIAPFVSAITPFLSTAQIGR